MKERLSSINEQLVVSYEENKKKVVQKNTSIKNSFRVYRDGFAGINYCLGEVDEVEGFQKAEANLNRKRPYPFEHALGVRHRDKTEEKLTDKEVVEIAEESFSYLLKTYPDFTFGGSFERRDGTSKLVSDAGSDYSNRDCCITASINFKHKASKDIVDGYFSFSLRKYDPKVFTRMADDYLANYLVPVDFPDEIIIDEQYYGTLNYLLGQINGENLALKTSLLTGKIGERIFNENFTLYHDVTDEETWFNPFWDGDGEVYENDRKLLIDHGTVLNGLAGKRDAKKYGIPYTGPSYFDFADVPSTGGVNGRIVKSEKTVKELLDGRMAVIPVMQAGGGYNDKGEYTMPVQNALLFDGEKILGKLPQFTIVTNFMDIFGKNFIGVGSDRPIYNDKQLLYKVDIRK